ncbi:MAG: hypothetical protein ABI605_04805 [Rhizobacter sp.]
MNARALALQAVIASMVVALGIVIYHRFVLPTSMRFGVVDVGEVYRLKEKQLLDMVTKPTVTDADKERAIAMALEFTKTLPAALEQLPRECKCFVLVRSAVAAESPSTVDLTPLLKSKIGV